MAYSVPLSTLLLWEKRDTATLPVAFKGADDCFGLTEGTAEKDWNAYQGAKEAEKAREAKHIKVCKLVGDVFAFELPDSVLEYVERASALGVSLTFHTIEGGDVRLKVLGAPTEPKATAKGTRKAGTNAKHLYKHTGAYISGPLSEHVVKYYPDSDAARQILAFKNGEKKGRISAWEAVAKDKVISDLYTRESK